MKSLLLSGFPILFLAAFSQAQEDTASVTFIPATGDYLLWYRVNGIEYADTLEPPTKIDPTVSCIMTLDAAGGSYNYVYTIGLLPASQQYLLSFQLSYSASIRESKKPSARWNIFDIPGHNKIEWSNTNINPSGLRADTTDIGPGSSMSGFSYKSAGLPTVIKAYFSGNAVGLAFTGEPPSRMEELLAPILHFPNNTVIRLTLGPKSPPTPFVPLDFLDTIKSYINQSRSLGWIADQTTTNKYTMLINSARSHLRANEIAMAKAKLDTVLLNVKKDSSITLTSEASVLLRFNTEYVLSRISQKK